MIKRFMNSRTSLFFILLFLMADLFMLSMLVTLTKLRQKIKNLVKISKLVLTFKGNCQVLSWLLCLNAGLGTNFGHALSLVLVIMI